MCAALTGLAAGPSLVRAPRPQTGATHQLGDGVEWLPQLASMNLAKNVESSE